MLESATNGSDSKIISVLFYDAGPGRLVHEPELVEPARACV